MDGLAASKFMRLFEGNKDFYGTEEGGCVGAPAPWAQVALGHLTGSTAPIGVYPFVNQTDVSWGCVDFDEGEEESRIHARNLRNVLSNFDIEGWIERSRSKGYHVWVFPESWVPAYVLREALLGACQLVDAPTKEINPKQPELPEGKIGNYVRLPYPSMLDPYGKYANPVRRVVIDPDTGHNMSCRQFVDRAYASRFNFKQLQTAHHMLWRPPPKPPRLEGPLYSELEGDATDRLSPLAYTIFQQGPRDVDDRSTRLWKLACLIQEGGQHTFDEAVQLMRDADERWGKFSERGQPEYITSLVEKVWLE